MLKKKFFLKALNDEQKKPKQTWTHGYDIFIRKIK